MKTTPSVAPAHPSSTNKAAPRIFSGRALFLLMLPFLIVLAVPLSTWLGERRPRMVCQSRMKALATAIRTNATGDEPATDVLARLLLAGTLTPQDITCPQADAPNYIIAHSLTSPISPGNVPLITEPLANHRGGGNVLWSDGHVEFGRGSAYEAARRRIVGLPEPPPP